MNLDDREHYMRREGTMSDRLAELCDRVAELEVENARLQKVVSADTEVIASATEQIADLAATIDAARAVLQELDTTLEDATLALKMSNDQRDALVATVAQLREAVEEAVREMEYLYQDDRKTNCEDAVAYFKLERVLATTAPKEEP